MAIWIGVENMYALQVMVGWAAPLDVDVSLGDVKILCQHRCKVKRKWAPGLINIFGNKQMSLSLTDCKMSTIVNRVTLG